jgi:deazaflavin-dependent oxidoreductase (nitroreductase family)
MIDTRTMRTAADFLKRLIAAFFSRVMRTRFAHRFVSPYFARLQQWLYHRTGNRFQISALLAPTLILHTTGAKTGQRRETPLLCWPEPDGSFVVSGSNWGKARHPAWTANLVAQPKAEITYKRRTFPVLAVLLDGAEREAIWPVLEKQFPSYRQYEVVAERRVRIFRLSPR